MSHLLNELFKEFESRENRGLKKYGTTMDRNDLELQEWVQHALEEVMDLTLYLYKIKLNGTQRNTDCKKENN